jgi:hypothetical protein
MSDYADTKKAAFASNRRRVVPKHSYQKLPIGTISHSLADQHFPFLVLLPHGRNKHVLGKPKCANNTENSGIMRVTAIKFTDSSLFLPPRERIPAY